MSGPRISRSSPGSGDSTSPSKPTATSVSDRSSGMTTAPESWSDGGPTSPGGEILLPTPVVTDAKAARNRTANRSDPNSKHHDGLTLSDALLPTPNASPYGYNQQDSPGAAKRPGLWTLFAAGSPASPPPPPGDARARRMIAGSGPSSPVWLASFDRALSWWRTSQVSLLSTEDERFPRSWETWPRSGMTRRGEAFALPTSVPAIGASVSSYLHTPRASRGAASTENQALLQTPTAADALGGHLTRGGDRSDEPLLNGQVKALLPTPVADKSRGLAQPGTDYQSLPNSVLSLGDLTSEPSEGGSE